MKVDKQQLIKHHFWILLGVFALFGLLLIILVPVLIGSEIKEKQAAYDSVASTLESKSKTYEQTASIVAPTEFLGGWPAVLHPVRWTSGVLPTSEEVWLSLEDLCVRREILTILHEGNETSARMQQVTKVGQGDPPLPQSPLGEKF